MPRNFSNILYIIRNFVFRRSIAAFSFLLLLAACHPMWTYAVDPSGPPEYRLGWQDGCDSGLSAEGGWDYKLMFGFKKRPEMASSDQYKQAWNEGFTYCRFSLASSKTPSTWEGVGLGSGF